MKKIILQRTERIKKIIPDLDKVKDLHGEVILQDRIIKNLQFCSKLVIYDCLCNFYENELFDCDLSIDKFFNKYKKKIIGLPNITPNGLVMPKLETLSSVNLLNKAVYDLIKFLKIEDKAEIACPINLRLNFGVNRNQEFNKRPKSSTYWHTDIWAGQNSNELMIHTPIFGDFQENGISICCPSDKFYPDFVKTIDHFHCDGNPATSEMDKSGTTAKLKIGKSYIFDSFLFHKTNAKGSGMRGIISFPIKLKDKLDSDIYQNPLRDSEYKTTSEWSKIGKETMLISNKKINQKDWKDENKNVYADKFQFINII